MIIALDNKTMASGGLREGSFHAALPSDFAYGICPSKQITSDMPDWPHSSSENDALVHLASQESPYLRWWIAEDPYRDCFKLLQDGVSS